uniref:CCHC-type domain-containing protein n=1 Tax=Trichogramma kaykai TaxID=54128 RepID=A0ABD2X844_9HYME
MKDEGGGKIMREFVGLRAKAYYCQYDGSDNDVKKAKGDSSRRTSNNQAAVQPQPREGPAAAQKQFNSSQAAARSTQQTDDVTSLVDRQTIGRTSFFRLELDETEIAQIETENIKQELQKTVACIQDTLEKPEIKEGFFEKCFNKFLEYVKVKEEDLSEFYETVIENKSLITHNNLLEKFEREEASGTDEEEIQINNMAYNRGPSFKDIIQLVPNFSGRDRDEAIKFVKGCKHAEELLDDNQQKDFLKFIRVKLSGVAHECIDTTEMENIKALTDFVESNFGSDKLFFECYGDLAKLKQENNETVLSFYARLKDVEREIEAVARRDSKYNQSFKANLQTDLLAAFKRGLRWEIKARLTANTLDEARNEAIKIEREDGFDGDRNKFKSYNKNMTLCTICESKEHSTIDCDTLKSLGKVKVEKCSYCQSSEHQLSNCIKFNIDTRDKQPEKCSHCGSTDHHLNNCMKFALKDKDSCKKAKEPEVITINHMNQACCSHCKKQGQTMNNNSDFIKTIYGWKRPGPSFAGDRRTEVWRPQQQQQQQQQQQWQQELDSEMIYNINYKSPSPTITIIANELSDAVELMLDTGAAVSVIKYSEISKKAVVDFDKKILLRGITDNTIRSIGETIICLNNEIPVKFQVVKNDFPIQEGGILGTRFFAYKRVNINYDINCLQFNNYSIPFNIKTVYQERKGMNHISKGTIDSQQNTDARKTVNQRINNICGVQACNNNIENLKFSDNPKRSEKETATQSISNKMSTAHKRVESKEALSQSATENELLYEENNFCTQYTVRNVDRDILDKQRDNNEHFGTKGIVHSEKALSNEQIDDYDENFDKMDAVCSDNRV